MAPTMKDLGIDCLSVDDRLSLVEEIWASIAADPESVAVTDEQKSLLERRMAELDANPANVLTWDEVRRSVQGE